jgi:hypothetical protein
MRIDRHDCRTGRPYRYLILGDGDEFGFRGCFHEVRPSELIDGAGKPVSRCPDPLMRL